ANEGFSLAISRNMALGVIKKFCPKRRIRRTIQTPLDGRAAATTACRVQHWIVLQIIWVGVCVAIVVRLDAVGVAVILQIDPEAGVRENGVAEQSVVDAPSVIPPDPGKKGITHRGPPAVEGDDVTRVRVSAAYGVVMTIDQDAAQITQRLCA